MKTDNYRLLNEILRGFHPSSYEHFVCSDYLEYLDRTFDSHIIAHGLDESMKPVPKDFGYPHRYTKNYIKGRFAKLYLLDDWYKLNPEMPMTFLTMTTRHKADSMSTLEESLTQGIRDSFKRLQKGNRLLMRELYNMKKESFPFVMVVEPHESGFPHYHMIIFASFTIDEQIRLRNFWEKWGIGSFEHGLDFDERPKQDNIKSLRNYLMKYMSKSFVDYSSKYGGVVPWTKEQLLFNAIAWKFGFRTWHASNELSKVMAYHPEKVDNVDWYETVLNSDVCEQHVLWKLDDEKKQVLKNKVDGYLKWVESVNFDG